MEPGVRLGHISHILWSPSHLHHMGLYPPTTKSVILPISLPVVSFLLKCRPFLLWKINPPHMFLFHFVQDLVLPSLLISLAFEDQCHCPANMFDSLPQHTKTHPCSSHFSPATAPFLFAILTTFFKRISCMNLDFMSLPAMYSHPPPVWFSVPSCTAQTVAISAWRLCWHVQGALFSPPPVRAQLHWPEWPVLPAGNALRFTSVPTQTRVFCLSEHFSPQSFLLVLHPLQPWCRSSLQLDLCLSVLLIHTPMILPPVLISNIIHMPSPVYICKLKPFFWTTHAYIHLLTWYVLLDFPQTF